jgi:hypothetical protein
MGPEENDCGLQGDGGAPMAGSAGIALEAPAQRGGGDRAGSGTGGGWRWAKRCGAASPSRRLPT